MNQGRFRGVVARTKVASLAVLLFGCLLLTSTLVSPFLAATGFVSPGVEDPPTPSPTESTPPPTESTPPPTESTPPPTESTPPPTETTPPPTESTPPPTESTPPPMESTPPPTAVSYTHLRAHETPEHLVCRLLLEKKNER